MIRDKNKDVGVSWANWSLWLNRKFGRCILRRSRRRSNGRSVVPVAVIEIENLQDILVDQESLSPVLLSPLVSPGPASLASSKGYNSDADDFGGAVLRDLFFYYCCEAAEFGGVSPECSWPGGFHVGRLSHFGALWGFPTSHINGMGTTSLLQAGETLNADFRGTLIDYPSQTAFQGSRLLQLMETGTTQEFRSQLSKFVQAWGFWELENACQVRSPVVVGWKFFLYRPVPDFVVSFQDGRRTKRQKLRRSWKSKLNRRNKMQKQKNGSNWRIHYPSFRKLCNQKYAMEGG